MKKSFATLSILAICLVSIAAPAQEAGSNTDTAKGVMISPVPVVPYLTSAVRDLPAAERWKPGDPVKEVPRLRSQPEMDVPPPVGQRDPLLDLQLNAPPARAGSFLTPIFNFGGQDYTGVNPPDTVGDVGVDHYIQGINASGGTLIQIYDKVTGTTVGSAFNLDSLGTGNCASGLGDPIILFDQAADRWMLSEFSNSGNQLCVYVSQTDDPTGAYYAYAFTAVNSFPDYPKYSVWPDAYYLGTNESSATLYALDRTNMLAGSPATLQAFNAPALAGFGFQMVTPADLDGATLPPAGSPGMFLRHRDTEAHGAGTCPNPGTSDCLEIFEFSVDWATPANSGISGPITVEVSEFDSNLCGLTSFTCIDQPGNSNYLDPLREVTMWRNQYRNFGNYEVLVGNLATDVSGSDDAGVRWFELRKTGAGPWSLHQEGTYAPDGDSRWMGSAAMDSSGNIAVAYNISSSSTYPGLRYAGRLQGDPLGTLPQGEGTIINGTANNASNRYGDYAAMSVDPVDDCTFWFTGEFNTASQWSTQITAMKFDACGTPDFTFSVTEPNQSICVGQSAQYEVVVGSVSGYTDSVTLGTSGEPGTPVFSINPVTPAGSSTLSINGAPAGAYSFDITGTSTTGTKSETVNLDVLSAAPGTVILTAPADGATSVSTAPDYSWGSVSSASSYFVEIADDPGFSNVVDSATVITNSYSSGVNLDTTTRYYWRVTAQNICGAGPSSPAFSFVTANINCATYASTDVPKLIPISGTSGTTTSNLDIVDTGEIVSLTVTLAGTHTWIGDLDFNLDSPGGTSVAFLDTASCGSVDNFDLTLDDDAAGTFPCPPTGGGSYQPSNPLATFATEEITGTWTMTINDSAGGDSGQLDEWALNICSLSDTVTGPIISVPSSSVDFVQPTNWLRGGALTINNIGTEDLIWTIVEDAGGNCDSPTDIPWLISMDSSGSTTAAGIGDLVSMVTDSAGLAPGQYSANLCIDSNDPITPRIVVPVNLEVVVPLFADNFETNDTSQWADTYP